MKRQIQLGLKENRNQFLMLVMINAFVGGMIGMERSVLPGMAENIFGIQAHAALLSFILVFGITKALSNYLMGSMANRFGRKRLLIAGWIFGIPVPFMLMYAQDWNWILAANVLLGINQGLAWSATVLMKIDLVGEKRRGFAMGINEFAGYLSVAAAAFLSAWIAEEAGLRPYPFYLGAGLVVAGLLSSVFLVRDTMQHVKGEAKESHLPRLRRVFSDTTFRHRNLGSVTQAGVINNLNDALIWGLLPLLMASKGYGIAEIGLVSGIYPAVWGIGQLFTGPMSDRFCKKDMLVIGMVLQGLVLLLFLFAQGIIALSVLSALLGWGTAMVYPTFLATVAENTHPEDRAAAMGIFRFWRDLGYAIGALLAGFIADRAGIPAAFFTVGLLTLASGSLIFFRMRCQSDGPVKLLPRLFRRSSQSLPGQSENCGLQASTV